MSLVLPSSMISNVFHNINNNSDCSSNPKKRSFQEANAVGNAGNEVDPARSMLDLLQFPLTKKPHHSCVHTSGDNNNSGSGSNSDDEESSFHDGLNVLLDGIAVLDSPTPTTTAATTSSSSSSPSPSSTSTTTTNNNLLIFPSLPIPTAYNINIEEKRTFPVENLPTISSNPPLSLNCKYNLSPFPPCNGFSASSIPIVSCYHACVAQKSYGTEKRFLCPPPMVHIKNTMFPKHTVISLTLINDDGTSSGLHYSDLEDQKCTFRYLHISNCKKQNSKKFHLRINIPSFSTNSSIKETILDTKPVTIISKPSKKTSKSRNNSLCLSTGRTVAFFNRVNSQTVRTKYIQAENGRFSASGSYWSAFRIIGARGEPDNIPIVYGMEVILHDVETGIYSDVLIIRKVQNNVLLKEEGGFVSQMQKVAFEPVNQPDFYLSIPTMHGEVIPNTMNTTLCYQLLHMKQNMESFSFWTIIGVEKSEYSLDPSIVLGNQVGNNTSSPSVISPVPTIPSNNDVVTVSTSNAAGSSSNADWNSSASTPESSVNDSPLSS